ncbi:iron uptake system protein EfeO [Nocardioides sp. Bht2]|uniref:iron uptake system protein EfeO n=1 Tax=Nocardioides sp. Bht2 TaxID=3392297 RepID=UPI0039B380AD
MKRIHPAGLLAVLAIALPLTACGTESTEVASGDDGDARTLTVTARDDKCEVSKVEAPAGTLRFNVHNAGNKVNEFYLLGEDGLQIVAEVENIGPGANSQLVVNAPAGSYFTACKPGMVGTGLRGDFTVTESDEKVEISADEKELISTAQKNYAAYVQDQSAQLLEKTTEFVQLYKDGKDDEARALYPVARTHWERIETVAESFGTLDPKMDAREADLQPGEKWTGWHRIEKDLWPQKAEKYTALTDAERATFADDLLANTTTLDGKIAGLTYPVDAIARGSSGLLEEVATGKVTGEEEIWSETDLWDFQANVDGAKVAFAGVQPIVETKDPALASTLSTRFDALQELLDAQRDGEGFKQYGELDKATVKQLADAVNALSEPLSRLAGVVAP